jgi:uncharacterized protein YfaQ (DUF2300 family)
MKWISASALLSSMALLPTAHAARDLACTPAPQIAARLTELARQWQPRLSTEPGYSPVPGVTVCLATSGLPFADQRNMRIYVRPLTSLDAQVTLAHEYLHLAFAHHPNGRNEAYIERMAQELVEQP